MADPALQDQSTVTVDKNAISTILDNAAKIQTGSIEIGDLEYGRIPYIILPTKGHKLETMQHLEHLLPAPLRKKGSVILNDAPSFIQYAKTHGMQGETTIWLAADFEKGYSLFTAILNDASAESSAWRDHIAVFSPAKSIEWRRWEAQDKKPMSQVEFASFIEDNLGDIATVEGMPTGSQIMEMSINFEATSEKRFKSSHRTNSGGVSLEYVDQEDGATQERMSMFSRFALGVAPFFNGPAYRLDVRLKYRINSGKLALWYELIRPDRVLKDATDDLIATIQDGAGFPFYQGNPKVTA